jgi:hypothetical protein
VRRTQFDALSAPSPADVLEVARRTAERIDKLLRASGRRLEPDGDGGAIHRMDRTGRR